MKIGLLKYYKSNFICFLMLGVCIIVGAIIFTFYYYQGEGLDDFIMLFLAVPIGIVISLFPILISYKQLNFVYLENDMCVSYSLLKKKLCQVNYNERVFYSFFDVKFAYAPVVKFIALSNTPFLCKQNPESFLEKKFYGTYDNTRIIVFPYDKQVAQRLNIDDWHNVRTGDG